MKLYSSEIRWFSKHKTDLNEIFNALPGTCFKEEERTDYYIRTQSPDIGIKIRGETNRVEIKWLGNKRSDYKINNEIIGKTEDYIKTGFYSNDPITSHYREFLNTGSYWIKIDKLRFKKKYNILNNSIVEALSMDNILPQSCEIEFTEIRVNNKYYYYSMGFESLKEDEISRRDLELTIDTYKTLLKAEVLKNIQSMGYAEFIFLFF